MKIKAVEALSAGCAMVMNQAGADGLEEGAGRAYLLARDWSEFADHVVVVLTTIHRRRELEGGARILAQTIFPPDVTFAELERVLRSRTR